MGTSLTVLSLICVINIIYAIDCINREDDKYCQEGCTQTNTSIGLICSCNTLGLTDLYFSIPIHQTSDWNQQLSMFKDIINAAVKPTSGIGMQTFGTKANQIAPITDISNLTYEQMNSLIDNIQYTADGANNLQLAMDNMLNAFSTRNHPKRQKFNIIFLNANPTYDGSFYDVVDICSVATLAKQQSFD